MVARSVTIQAGANCERWGRQGLKIGPRAWWRERQRCLFSARLIRVPLVAVTHSSLLISLGRGSELSAAQPISSDGLDPKP